jgi:hypothetical protein
MGFSLVTEGTTNEADWTTRFSLVTKGVGLRVRNGGSWLDVLFLGIRDVIEIKRDLPQSGDTDEV